MKARGGTEIQLEGLSKYLAPPPADARIILNGCDLDLLEDGYKYILWQHQNTDNPHTNILGNKSFIDKMSALVFISGWQYERYRHTYPEIIDLDKSYIIKNAIEKIEYMDRPKSEKKKLIYTSTPWRGLSLLLDSFELLDRDDVELDIYSSTIIYGSDFYAKDYPEFQAMFDRAKAMKNVNYYGYASNEDVRAALQTAHIFSYPSNFEETSCISMIEAGAAGCQLVSTYYGAIPETSSGWANLVSLKSNKDDMVASFASALNYAIDNRDEDLLKKQSDFFNEFYSWERRKHEWNNLINDIYSIKNT